MRIAALNGDIWSTYAEKLSSLEELGPHLTLFEDVCERPTGSNDDRRAAGLRATARAG